MSMNDAPAWMKGIRRRFDYGWRYHGRPTGLLSDNSISLDDVDADIHQLLINKDGNAFPAACFQCGTCTSLCPYGLVTEDFSQFSPRLMARKTQLGRPPLESAESWLCCTCRACEDQCPRGIRLTDFMKALRGIHMDFGLDTVPESLRRALRNIASVGNPFGEPRHKRTEWANNIGVKRFTQGMDVLYFPGCFAAYDARARKVAAALVNILRKADVKFGVLGEDENCCGESVRKAGAEELYRTLAQQNISLFAKTGAAKILTSSPHCYHTFKTEYPSFGGDFEVVHHTQYLGQLIRSGRLKLGRLDAIITYHDPCYLGRYHNLYDTPREILQHIPGVKLVEMERSRTKSICCGGGGARIWQEAQRDKRLCDVRLEQARQTGAATLVVSCPYCLTNFEDSLLTSPSHDTSAVKDITELVWEAVRTRDDVEQEVTERNQPPKTRWEARDKEAAL